MRFQSLVRGVVALLLMFTGWVAAQNPAAAKLKILTYNVYQGTDFTPVRALLLLPPEQQLADFPGAVAASLEQVVASDPFGRAAAIARQIARTHPDIVLLQEANSWYITLPSGEPFVFDFKSVLLADLAALRLDYALAAESDGFVLGLPSIDPEHYLPAVTTDHNLVLVSGDLHPGEISVGSSQVNAFPDAVTLFLPIPGGPAGGVPITRNWLTTEVSFRGRSFNLVSTHLEAFYPPATMGQASLLLAQVGASGPAVLAGDFNANASDVNDPTYSVYELITQAGFTDAWDAAHPSANPPGYTCCQLTDVGSNLTNFKSLFSQRIDHVFARDVTVISAQVIGRGQSARTASGLWPSDHGGLLVEIALK